MPIRNRIFLNTLLVLLLGMGLAALLSWRAVENLYIETQRENLLVLARLTANAFYDEPLPTGIYEPYSQTSNTLPGIRTRFVSQQGLIVRLLPLGEVSAPAAEIRSPIIPPEELRQRPEIASAIAGQADTAVRRVEGRRVLYAAAPVLDNVGAISGLVYLSMPLSPGGLPFNLFAELAAAVLASALLALIAGTILARRIVLPVEAISRAAASLNLDEPVPARSGIRELDDLGQAFNSMTASLRQSEQAKNAFIADVTHELRTPLTVIKGTVETLEDGALDDINGRGPLLASMQRETERLIRLVNDLLVLTRADAGDLRLNLAPLDLLELARSRCEHFAPLAARRRVSISVSGADSAPITGDADRLAQVLDNLLDNALRYSPERSRLAVEIGRGAGQCWCAVKDQGPGIPEKHLPFIFDRFYRAESSRDRQTGGAGLGLAIARSLVQVQGGHIEAESLAGHGTTIRFSLPSAI